MNAGCAGKPETPLERVSYLSAIEVCSRQGAIGLQIQTYLTLPYLSLIKMQVRIDQIISLCQPYVWTEQTAKLGVKYSKLNR